MEAKIERVEGMCGGKGHVIIKRILGEKELNGKCRMYAQVTIEPDCSLGFHMHHGESETYYILKGKGIYDDNGVARPVQTRRHHFYRRRPRPRAFQFRNRRPGVHGADYFRVDWIRHLLEAANAASFFVC